MTLCYPRATLPARPAYSARRQRISALCPVVSCQCGESARSGRLGEGLHGGFLLQAPIMPAREELAS